MINNLLILDSMNENDRRALITVIVIAVVLFLLLGFIGMGIRKTMQIQGNKMETMMHDVVKTGIVSSPRQFKAFARKKNRRLLYRETLRPFGVGLLGLAAWTISNIITGDWGLNFFYVFFDELFVHFTWPTTQFFGLTIVSNWPQAIEGTPNFQLNHLGAYISAALFLIAIAWFAFVCQAFLSRTIRMYNLSRTIYEKRLEGYNANEAMGITPTQAPTQED